MDVICTAGHVDHGKSTLVRALTGMEPDRFAEEQRRGLTIDIGFAWTALSDDNGARTVAFVDLPGHERFIANMLAGAGPVEVTMFTVAADEGWKPQSSEHRDILDLLDVSAGVVVITKCDLATAEQLRATRAAVREQLEGTALAPLPVVEVSAVTGAGLEALRAALLATLRNRSPAPPAGMPRLWVDRAFTIRGAGTVVTGTLTGGALAVGDDVVVLPRGTRGRVRGLQSLQETVERAHAGDRVAVNLSGVERDEVRRGTVVAAPVVAPPAQLIDVEVRTLPGSEVGRRGAWHLHAGAGDWPVTVRPFDGVPITGHGPARLQLDDPAPVVAGDRFVLRDSGRRATVAGGTVLDTQPPQVRGAAQRRQRVEQLHRRREALAAGDRQQLLSLHVQERLVVPAPVAAAAVGLDPAAAATAARLIGLVDLAGAWAHPSSVGAWAAAVREAVARYHAAHADQPAAPRDIAVAAATGAGCPAGAVADLLAVLVRGGHLVPAGAGVRLPDHGVRLTADQQRSRRVLLEMLAAAPFSPPRLGEAAAAAGASEAVVREMEAAGDVVRLAPDLVMTAEAVAQAVDVLRRVYATEGPLTAARAKESLGTSRKYALPLLEELDRRGKTRREGDVRHVMDSR